MSEPSDIPYNAIDCSIAELEEVNQRLSKAADKLGPQHKNWLALKLIANLCQHIMFELNYLVSNWGTQQEDRHE